MVNTDSSIEEDPYLEYLTRFCERSITIIEKLGGLRSMLLAMDPRLDQELYRRNFSIMNNQIYLIQTMVHELHRLTGDPSHVERIRMGCY